MMTNHLAAAKQNEFLDMLRVSASGRIIQLDFERDLSRRTLESQADASEGRVQRN